MDPVTPEKIAMLKVMDLRKELRSRGLSVSGIKDVLVARLRQFLLEEVESAKACADVTECSKEDQDVSLNAVESTSDENVVVEEQTEKSFANSCGDEEDFAGFSESEMGVPEIDFCEEFLGEISGVNVVENVGTDARDVEPTAETALGSSIVSSIDGHIQTENVPETVEEDNVASQQPQLVSEIQVNSHLAAEVANQMTSEIEPQLAAELEPQLIAETEAQLTAEIEPQLTAEIEPQLTTEIETQMVAEITSQVAVEVEPQVTAEVENQMTVEIEPQLTDEAAPQSTTEVEPQLTAEIEPQSTREIEPQSTVEAEPQMPAEVQPTWMAEIESQWTAAVKHQLAAQIEHPPFISKQPEADSTDIVVVASLEETTLSLPVAETTQSIEGSSVDTSVYEPPAAEDELLQTTNSTSSDECVVSSTTEPMELQQSENFPHPTQEIVAEETTSLVETSTNEVSAAGDSFYGPAETSDADISIPMDETVAVVLDQYSESTTVTHAASEAIHNAVSHPNVVDDAVVSVSKETPMVSTDSSSDSFSLMADVNVSVVVASEQQIEGKITNDAVSVPVINDSLVNSSGISSDLDRPSDSEGGSQKRKTVEMDSPVVSVHSGKSRKHRHHPAEEREEETATETTDAPWLQDDTFVMLDTYNADLNLKIANNRMQAEPLSQEAFALMWAGVRGTFGVSEGKVGFEVKITDHIDVSHITLTEEHYPHLLRIGWSRDSSGFQLGNEKCSYGYDGSGKIIENSWMKDYGRPFSAGDVVSALIDFDEREISFMKNGQHFGCAFRMEAPKVVLRIPEELLIDPPVVERPSFPVNRNVIPLLNDDDIEILTPPEEDVKPIIIQEPEVTIINDSSPEIQPDMPLFPHVATKNSKFEVNFGQLAVPWFPLPKGFSFINDLPLDKRNRGSVAPDNKRDCKVMMMVGLPGCGKTFWVEHFLKSHPDEKWNLLSINAVLDQMREMGVSRKKNLQGRWDVLMGMSAKCLSKLLTVACRKKRNYVVDQTNVSVPARKRKMAPFKEFRRKAIVMVPKEEVYNERFRRQEHFENRQIPPETLLEMKGNFVLPEETDNIFDEIEFVELPRDLASLMVAKYNEEGKVVKPPPEKKGRWNDKKNKDSQPISNDAQAPGPHVRVGFPSGNTAQPTPVPTPRAAWGAAARNPNSYRNRYQSNTPRWGQPATASSYRYGAFGNFTTAPTAYSAYTLPATGLIAQQQMYGNWAAQVQQQQQAVTPQMYGGWVAGGAVTPTLPTSFVGSQWPTLYGAQPAYRGALPPPPT